MVFLNFNGILVIFYVEMFCMVCLSVVKKQIEKVLTLLLFW